jgi:hypothetical protein
VEVRVAAADWRWPTSLHCTCNTTYSLCQGVGEPAFSFVFWRIFSIWRNLFFLKENNILSNIPRSPPFFFKKFQKYQQKSFKFFFKIAMFSAHFSSKQVASIIKRILINF